MGQERTRPARKGILCIAVPTGTAKMKILVKTCGRLIAAAGPARRSWGGFDASTERAPVAASAQMRHHCAPGVNVLQ